MYRVTIKGYDPTADFEQFVSAAQFCQSYLSSGGEVQIEIVDESKEDEDKEEQDE